jgi:hypothetical protein
VSTLYDLVNVYDKDKKWIGQFSNEDVAMHWLKRNGFNTTECEITKRRPEWERD